MLFKVKAPGMEQAVKRWKEVAGPGLEQTILDAAEEAAQRLLQRIRQNAHKAGKDWGMAADAAWVQRLSNNVVVMLPQKAFDYEYGTGDVPPRPVVRQTIQQMGPYLKGFFNKTLRVRVFEKGAA